MELSFFNTLTRRQEPFQPLQPGQATLYTCGPTVYNFAHIGNFRAYVFEDLLRRVLKFNGYRVTQVMNLTDVDDKTIRDSRAAGLELDVFTRQFKDAFFQDLKTVRVEPAEVYPEATRHVPEMIALIQALLDKGFAYQAEDGSVYFSIARYPRYGQLAHVDLASQRVGDRVRSDEYEKEAVADFALWKAYSPDDGNVVWDSPWGRGRPGWHIECSAMSMKYLGPHFDLHTGGIDNMFPHHEDEIAQSECANGEKFVNYWLHCEHLLVDGQKMSKSLGNFFTLRDLLKKGYSGREIRWILIGSHYRQKLNFQIAGLDNGRVALRRLDDFSRRLKEAQPQPAVGLESATALAARALQDFHAAINDDLNLARALAALFDLLRDANRALDAKEIAGAAVRPLLDLLRRADTVLGVLDVDSAEGEVPAEILAKVQERQAARKARDFARSDALRDELLKLGWKIEDSPQGPRVVRA